MPILFLSLLTLAPRLQPQLPILPGRTGVLFSKDGEHLFSTSKQDIYKWHVRSGLLAAVYPGFDGTIRLMKMSDDGATLAVTAGNTLRLVSTADGQQRARYVHTTELRGFAFAGDSIELDDSDKAHFTWRPTGGATLNGTARWDGNAGYFWGGSAVIGCEDPDRPSEHLGDFSSVTGFKGVTAYALSGPAGRIRLCDGAKKVRIRDMRGGLDDVLSADISADGRYLVFFAVDHFDEYYGNDRVAKVWDMLAGRFVYTLPVQHRGRAVALTPDNRLVVRRTNGATIVELPSGKVLAQWDEPEVISTFETFSSGANYIVAAPFGGVSGWYDTRTGKRQSLAQSASSNAANTDFTRAAFTRPQGANVLTSPHAIDVYDTSTQRLLYTVRDSKREPAPSFAPNGELLFVGMEANVLRITRDGQPVRTITAEDAITAFGVDPTSRRVVAAVARHGVQCLDYSTGQTLWSTEEPGMQPERVRFLDDGGVAFIGRYEVDVRELATGAARYTARMPAGDMLITTPDGYYAGSPGSFRGLALVDGDVAYPADQFDVRLNRPDLVYAKVGHVPAARLAEYARARSKRLKKLGVDEATIAGDLDLPTLRVTSTPPATTTERTLRVPVEMSAGARRLHVLVNDVPLFGRDGQDVTGKTSLIVPMTLSAGRNRIRLSVRNARGVESMREQVLVSYVGEAPPPELRALLIGVSRYRDASNNLVFAAKDAQDMAKLLTDRAGQRARVKLLTDEAATRDEILKARQFLSEGGVDDELVVFIAGHGLLDEKLDYYFASHDTSFAAPSTGVSYDTLEGLLDGITARKKLLLMDTCFSGETDDNDIRPPPPGFKVRAVRGISRQKARTTNIASIGELLAQSFADLRQGSGAVVISSAGGAEFALESEQWRNGVFTYALLDALQNSSADADKNGLTELSELRNYVFNRVETLTGGQQKPTARRDNLGSEFALVTLKAPPKPKAEPPPPPAAYVDPKTACAALDHCDCAVPGDVFKWWVAACKVRGKATDYESCINPGIRSHRRASACEQNAAAKKAYCQAQKGTHFDACMKSPELPPGYHSLQ